MDQTPPAPPTSRRKDAHLDLTLHGAVEPPGNATLFGDVHLLHEALPELAFDEVSLRSRWFGKMLAMPLFLTGMTGGTERARTLNRALAEAAEGAEVAFALGSQRAMLEDPSLAATFSVREVAPTIPVIGNLGLWQARTAGVDKVQWLMEAIGADALAIHLNPAQELIQPEGDRDFRGGLATLEGLARVLGDRLFVKETGCGLAPRTVARLIDAGVTLFDLSGLGGTSWIAVEALRAEEEAGALGACFSGWGIPTAAALLGAVPVARGRARLIASGGLRNGLDAAKALALGADAVGVALPALKAAHEGAAAGVARFLAGWRRELATAMVLTGSRDLAQLRVAPRVITGQLAGWAGRMPAVPSP